jgi:hypothetical protein
MLAHKEGQYLRQQQHTAAQRRGASKLVSAGYSTYVRIPQKPVM